MATEIRRNYLYEVLSGGKKFGKSMPRRKEELEQIGFRVPQKMLEHARNIADSMGLSMGDAHRDFWIAGVQSMAERQNKVFVNKGLREKYEEIDDENE